MRLLYDLLIEMCRVDLDTVLRWRQICHVVVDSESTHIIDEIIQQILPECKAEMGGFSRAELLDGRRFLYRR